MTRCKYLFRFAYTCSLSFVLIHSCIPYRVDYVYVENLCYGHFLGEKGLWNTPDEVAGNVFCISDSCPVSSAELGQDILLQLHPEELEKVSAIYLRYDPLLMRIIQYVVEGLHRVFPKIDLGELNKMTPSLHDLQRESYLFSSAKAERVLGYQPLYSIEQAIRKSVEEFRQGHFLPRL